MTTALRFLWAGLTWLAYELVFHALALAGVLAVPLAIRFGVTRASRIYPDLTIFTAPDWLCIYGNEQEGYDSPFAISLHPTMNRFLRRCLWAAWRNKVCNFRFIKALHPPPDPDRIAYIRTARWWLCWQGPLYCFHYTKRSGAVFKIGWKYTPEDKDGVKDDDWRRWGCGFTFRVNAR